MMILMRSRPLMCCYQLQGFGRVPILWVQSTKQPFPWPTFPALWSTWKDQRTMRQTVLESLLQWEENTTAHTSLGVTGNTLHSGNVHSRKRDQVSSHCHHKEIHQMGLQTGWLVHRGLVRLLRSHCPSHLQTHTPARRLGVFHINSWWRTWAPEI